MGRLARRPTASRHAPASARSTRKKRLREIAAIAQRVGFADSTALDDFPPPSLLAPDPLRYGHQHRVQSKVFRYSG